MSYLTQRQRVSGLGSAKEGVGHWWAQRLTSIALVPLTVLFLFPLSSALGATYEEALAVFAHPWNALIAVLFMVAGILHLQQGMQVVIEDYVPHGPRTVLLIANTLLCWALGIVAVFAVARIAIAG